MGKNKKSKVYILEAVKSLGEYLDTIRKDGANKIPNTRINPKGLQEAVMNLPKNDRENIEKFWGLTGGPNHSKKMRQFDGKDVAYIQMMRQGVGSAIQLMRLDYVAMYDEALQGLVEFAISKINKEGCEHLSDLECVKYLLTFLILVENGPKMSFEKDLMAVETRADTIYHLDEYKAFAELCKELKAFSEKSINLSLIKGLFEMWDVKDCMAIQKNFGIQFDEDVHLDEVEKLSTFGQIRAFKERVFEHGAWEVTCGLVMGYDVKLDEFMEATAKLHRDWSKITDFKTCERKLNTSKETRTLNVYSIGGLEFTDPYEIMFLYLERNCIAA